MHNTYRFLVFLTLLTFSVGSFSQHNTLSPYSRFGIGLISNEGFGQNIAMGGTGIGVQAPGRINYLNPASYTSIDTMSFLFDFGINGSNTIYRQGNDKSSLANFNIDHISIGFPITKWMKFAAGVSPYSSVGYNVIEQNSIPSIGFVDYTYEGTGGLSRLFVGSSFKFLRHFSVGANMSYMFGYLGYNSKVTFPKDATYAVSTKENRLVVSDINWNFGAQFNYTFKNNMFVTLGGSLDNESKLNASQSVVNTTYFPGRADTIWVKIPSGDSTVLAVKTIFPNVEVDRTENDGEIVYPKAYGLGFSTGINDKLIIAADYRYQEWSKSSVPGISDPLMNYTSYRGGLEYIPNSKALRGYLNHVKYRLGGYYTNTYLRIGENQIKDYGISFGVGLPLRGMKSTFNAGVVLGQRGMLNDNLVKENYSLFNLSLTLHEFWFFKPQFD